MSAWKALERSVAALFHGVRFPANVGGSVDCEADKYCIQVKLRRTLSLEALTQLAEQAERDGQRRNKIGVVAVKVRRGKGHPSPGLIVMTFEEFRKMGALGTPFPR